jgi:hypothetical protein
MIALISTLLGLMGGFLPKLLGYFERKKEHQYALEIHRLNIEAARENIKLQVSLEEIKSLVDEGKSLRDHDSQSDGGWFIQNLRASVRPVITYIFFALFIVTKVTVFYIMLNGGAAGLAIMAAIWDEATVGLFCTIMAFWFGSRAAQAAGLNNTNVVPQVTTTKTRKKE